MKQFNKKPICEECGKNEAISFSFFEDKEAMRMQLSGEDFPPLTLADTQHRRVTLPDIAKRDAVGFSGRWKFTCECTSHTEDYYIMLDSFFSRPGATVDWLAHMNGKPYMEWPEFMFMMERFRKATNSFYEN